MFAIRRPVSRQLQRPWLPPRAEIVFCATPVNGIMCDIAEGGGALTAQGSPSVKARTWGLTQVNADTSSCYKSARTLALDPANVGYTFVQVAAPASSGSRIRALVLGDESAGAGYRQFALLYNGNRDYAASNGLLTCMEYASSGVQTARQSIASQVDGNYHVFVAVRKPGSSGTTMNVWRDGVNVNDTGYATATVPASQTGIGVGASPGYNEGTTDPILLTLIIARPWADAEVIEYGTIPALFRYVFRSAPVWLPPVPAGGSSYSVAISESASAADVASFTIIALAAISDAASAADSAAATGTLLADVANAATAADAPAATAILGVSALEAATAADATSTIAALLGAATESAAAADTVSALLVAVAAAAESTSAADAAGVLGSFGGIVAEGASAADAQNWGGSVYALDVSEAATAADAVAAALAALAAASEAAAAGDNWVCVLAAGAQVLDAVTASAAASAALQAISLLTESATAADAVSSGAGGAISGDIAEAAAAGDVVYAVAVRGVLVLAQPPTRRLTAGAARPAAGSGRPRPANRPRSGR